MIDEGYDIEIQLGNPTLSMVNNQHSSGSLIELKYNHFISQISYILKEF